MIDLFEWRKLIASERGPDSLTRLVLFVLSFHMDRNGNNCFPSIDLLSRETNLVPSTVKNRLARAQAAGWLSKSKRKRSTKGWNQNIYSPLIPSFASPCDGPPSRDASPCDGPPSRDASPCDGPPSRDASPCDDVAGPSHISLQGRTAATSSSLSHQKRTSGPSHGLPMAGQIKCARIEFLQFGKEGLEKFCREQGVTIDEALRLIGETDG
jgi:hypothetical protein